MSDGVSRIGRALFSVRDTGVIVPLRTVSMPGWEPKLNHCHHNATEWVEQNPEWKAVRGWLFFDFRYMFPFVRFTAHSVVEDPNGVLLDITPNTASQLYPFIRHPGSEDNFDVIVEKAGLGEIDYEFSRSEFS